MRFASILTLFVLLFMPVPFLLCPIALAEESWEQIHGGPEDDFGRCVRQTSDGGFIITGMLDTVAAEREVWLLKTDVTGVEEWSRTYGSEETDIGAHVEQTDDGGYIVTGVSYTSSFNNSNILLLKTDSSGEEEWRRLFDFGGRDYGFSVQQTTDGGYIVTGHVDNDLATYDDLLLLKTNAAGNEQWHRVYGTDWYDNGKSVQQTTDGGYVVLSMWDGGDVRLLKTNETGIAQWSSFWSRSYEDEMEEVLQLPDGGYIIVGTTESSGPGWQSAWLIRTDAGGNEVWNRTYGGEGSEHGESVHLTADGGFIFTGRTSTFGAVGGDAWLVKTDGSGLVQWLRTFGGRGNQRGHSVRQTADGGFIVAGRTAQSTFAEENLYLLYYRPDELLPAALVTGPGPVYDNPPLVRLFPPDEDATHLSEFSAYGVDHFGVNVACGNVDDSPAWEIITGAGPGELFGPHVRGFGADGTPVPGLDFLAYGTNKYGVNVAAGDLDGDGFDEIVTGAGPGAVFGPHVRAWDYDETSGVSPIPGVNYFAYGTPKWGVNVASGDIDGDRFDEIITGAGPGAVYGPHVRGWNVDGGTAQPIPGVSFMAYGTHHFGVVVSCGDVNGDGIDDLVTAPGPSAMFASHIRGWRYDGATVSPLAGLSFYAWGASLPGYGARVDAGTDLDNNGRNDLVVGAGPDPSIGSPVRVFDYNGTNVELRFSLQAYPPGTLYGTNVAAGMF